MANLVRRGWLRNLALGAAAVTFGAAPAVAQDYPTRPVRILVAFQAGQGTDVASRYFANELSNALGQSFVVENKPGAGGNLGTQLAAQAEPDGYTLVMGTAGTHAMNPNLYSNPGFDVEKDFDPIAAAAMIPMAILVNPSLKVDDLGGLVQAAKAKPGSIEVALPSTTSRLVNELLKQNGVELFPVVYKGSATAVTDVIGGRVPVLIDTVAASRPLVGKLTMVAVTSAGSSALMPNVRSVAEQGLPGFEIVAWNVLYAPSGTPQSIRDRLAGAMHKILSKPETAQKLHDLGFEVPKQMSEQELRSWVRAERQKFGALIQKAGLKVE